VSDRLDPAWRDELFEWLRIPSVSADPTHAGDVRRAGEWVCEFVRGAGGEAELVETETHPLALGELRASTGVAEAPTVLLYGHFDVQPTAPLDLWESDPFEPELRDGFLYCRGAVDDKGNAYLLLKGARLLAEEGALPVNVRVAFDGEEEIGGHSIVDFLAADGRGADACLIFDSGMPREDTPAFDLAVRGLVYFHVRLRTGERELHSGVFGGAALNAVHALMRTLETVAALPDELGAGVIAPTEEEIRSWQELDPGTVVLAEAGARPLYPDAGDELYLRTFAAPAVDVNGIQGGEPILQKTVLPVFAEANVSIRLAPGQDVEEIAAAFERILSEAAPEGAELEIERRSSSPPGLIPPDAPAVRLAQDAFERVLGRRPLLLRSGGTIPLVPALSDRGIPTILSGFALPGANIHSPNERLLARYVPLGVETARETLVALGGLR
jgi:acetylornithine deacetylase/succinyl-diaminopimelate desuccinylase-like protein